MRFVSLINIGQNKSTDSLYSGVQMSTLQGIQLGQWAVEANKIYEVARISATCTAGSLLYRTGTNLNYVTCAGGTGAKPVGVSLISPAASGMYTYMLKNGICNVQITNTFGITNLGMSSCMYGGFGSGAVNFSAFCTNIISGDRTGSLFYIGQALTNAADSTCLAQISLL